MWSARSFTDCACLCVCFEAALVCDSASRCLLVKKHSSHKCVCVSPCVDGAGGDVTHTDAHTGLSFTFKRAVSALTHGGVFDELLACQYVFDAQMS